MFSAVAVADEYYWKSFTSSIHTANAGNIEIMHDRYPDPFSYCAAYADAYVSVSYTHLTLPTTPYV
mgnify:CR=1 FL=1